MVDRRQPDELRPEQLFVVLAILGNPGGAGLAAGGVARHGRRRCGAAGLRHQRQHAAHFARHGGRDDLHAFGRLIVLEQGDRENAATVGEDEIGMRQLQGGDTQPVTETHGDAVDRAPAFHGPHQPAGRAGKLDLRTLAEAHRGVHIPLHLRWHLAHHLRSGDVARILDDLGQFDIAVVAVIADIGAVKLLAARRGMEHRRRGDDAGLQGCAQGDGLEHRARFKGIGHGVVADVRLGHALAGIRIEAGVVGHCQNLSRFRIDHHRTAVLGLVVLDRLLERLVGEVLDLAVDRQAHILSVHRRHAARHILDHITQPVFHDLAHPGVPGQPRLQRQLHAVLPLAFDIGKADELRRRRAFRVVAFVAGRFINALDAQRLDLLGHVDVHLPLEIDELFVGVEPALKIGGVQAEQPGELLHLVVARLDLRRIGPYGLGRNARRQNVAVAVENAAAHRRQLDGAHKAQIALVLIELRRPHLHPEGAQTQRRKRRKQQPLHQPGATWRQLHIQQRALAIAGCRLGRTHSRILHRRAPLLAGFGGDCGMTGSGGRVAWPSCTKMVRAAVMGRMSSWVRAILSMRPGALIARYSTCRRSLSICNCSALCCATSSAANVRLPWYCARTTDMAHSTTTNSSRKLIRVIACSSDPLCHAQHGRARPRIAADFRRRRPHPHHLLELRLELGRNAGDEGLAPIDRRCAGMAVNKAFDQRVFQRMKADHGQPPARPQAVEHLAQRRFDLRKLGIDVNPKSLKRAGGRVLARLTALDGTGNQCGEFAAARERRSGIAASHNLLCNLDSRPFVSIIPQHGCNFIHAGRGQILSDGLPAAVVHPHIQRPVSAEAEAALGLIELRRRHTQIEQQPIGLRHALLVQHPRKLGEWRVLDHKTRIVNLGRGFDGLRIAVDRNQPPGGRQPPQNFPAVSATPESRVEVHPVRVGDQLVDRLVQQHGAVRRFGAGHGSGVGHTRSQHNVAHGIGHTGLDHRSLLRLMFGAIPDFEVTSHADEIDLALQTDGLTQFGRNQHAPGAVHFGFGGMTEIDALPALRRHGQLHHPIAKTRPLVVGKHQQTTVGALGQREPPLRARHQQITMPGRHGHTTFAVQSECRNANKHEVARGCRAAVGPVK